MDYRRGQLPLWTSVNSLVNTGTISQWIHQCLQKLEMFIAAQLQFSLSIIVHLIEYVICLGLKTTSHQSSELWGGGKIAKQLILRPI